MWWGTTSSACRDGFEAQCPAVEHLRASWSERYEPSPTFRLPQSQTALHTKGIFFVVSAVFQVICLLSVSAVLSNPVPPPRRRPQGSAQVEAMRRVHVLGIDPVAEASMLWIAEEAFLAPLPPFWHARDGCF